MPLRASATIDAPEDAVRRALMRADVWTRTVRALGADAEFAEKRVGPRAPLRTGDLVRIRRRSAGRRALGTLLPPRSLVLRVTVDADRLPMFEVLAGPVPPARITLTTANTADGTLVTVTAAAQAVPLPRRRFRRVSELLFGIVTLASREQLVVVAAAVIEDGRVLAARRGSPPELAGRWELPGGKVDPGETDAVALARELAEELGLTVSVGDRIGGEVDLGNNAVLRCYRAEIVAGRPKPLEHDAVQWVDAAGLDAVDWLEPDREVFAELRPMLSG
jgi:8-oxo-dGTP diphosphatase